MENTLERNNELSQDVSVDIEMSEDEYEALLDKQIAMEFEKLDSKKKEIEKEIQQANLKINQNQTRQTEKEIEMNAQAQETLNVVNETAAVAVAESNTKVVAKKVAIILGKGPGSAVVGGGLVEVGAHNHKKVNKAVKSARKRIGKVIPAVAPKPWWKF